MRNMFMTVLSLFIVTGFAGVASASAPTPAPAPATAPATAPIAASTGQTYRTSAQSRAEFEAVGRPSMLKVKGHGARLVGEIQTSEAEIKGKFQVLMDGFTTDIDLRDRHMKEKYLMTKEHPRATLELSPIALPKGWQPGQQLSTVFKGELTLKGVKKPVEGTFKTEGANMKTEAAFTAKLSDFGIDVPKYMGITIADTVTIKATIPAFGVPKEK
ncbi:MAG TPA: YceI family protein [Pseudobdellovibrionaceae bacterium]|nr:YceI family protein [Pseudobdellovibrionaceae bacterium]